MKNIVVMLFISFHIFAQNDEQFSFKFDNVPLSRCITTIEQETTYHFFYIDHWLEDEIINADYKQQKISFILNDLFLDGSLNFYIKEKKVYLSKNNRIHDVSKSIFIDSEVAISSLDSKPLNSKDYLVQNNVDLIVVGKESAVTKKWGKITGTVKNSFGDNLNNVIISSEGLNNRVSRSNRNGNFSIILALGPNKLTCKLEGYTTTTIDLLVLSNGVLNIQMEDLYTKLETVRISAKKSSQLKKVALGITNVDISSAKKIPSVLGERDLLRIATTMPGIKSAGEGSQGFNVRGGKSDQNLIVLDDAVLYNPSHYFGMFSAITSSVIDNISIHKGSIPIEFGGRLSSLIDIETKDFKGENIIGNGSLGFVSSSIMLGVPILKQSGVIGSFRTSNTNWLLKNLRNESLKDKKLSFYDGLITFNSNLNKKNKIKSTIYISQDNFNTTNDSIYNYKNQLISVDWKHTINKNINLITHLSNSRYNFDILYNGKLNNGFNFGFDINESLFSIKLQHSVSNKHKLIYGVSQKYYRILPGEITPLDEYSSIENKVIETEKGLESSVYLSDKFKFSDKLSLNLGVRYSLFAKLGKGKQYIYYPDREHSTASIKDIEYFDNNQVMQYYGVPEFRASVRYLLSEDFSIKASVNQNTQFLHTLSNNTTASPVDTWTLSNNNIEPQKAIIYSLGTYKDFYDKTYILSLESYYKTMKNTIDFKTGAQLYMNNTIETQILNGTGKAYGIELLLKKNKGKLDGWLSYTYSRAFLKLQGKSLISAVNEGNYFPTNYDKPHDISLISSYNITERYSVSLNAIYQTGRPITYPIGKYEYAGIEHVLYSERNKFRIPDYYRIDVGVNIEGNHKIKKIARSFWTISVYNVLGRNNPYSVFFVNDKGSIKAFKTRIFSVPVPSVTYNFRF